MSASIAGLGDHAGQGATKQTDHAKADVGRLEFHEARFNRPTFFLREIAQAPAGCWTSRPAAGQRATHSRADSRLRAGIAFA